MGWEVWGGWDPLGCCGKMKDLGKKELAVVEDEEEVGGVAGVVPHPGAALPSCPNCEREGNMEGHRRHRVRRRLGT